MVEHSGQLEELGKVVQPGNIGLLEQSGHVGQVYSTDATFRTGWIRVSTITSWRFRIRTST